MEKKEMNTETPTKMPIKCRLFGHDPHSWTDGGYEVCKRCGMHGYYDYDNGYYHRSAILYRPIWWMRRQWSAFKYWIGRKYKTIKKEDDGLPF
jgi:hypothetical protein